MAERNDHRDARHADIHESALKEFNDVQAALSDGRLQSLEARRFYSIPGAQWEGPLLDQFENKPRFEMNKVHLAVIRIINEYRNNRTTAIFSPKDGQDDKLAEVCTGLYRADEQDSCAEEAYDNAFEEAVGGGIGAWRLRACYENDDDDDDTRQRVRIEPIYDADSTVFFDLNAKRQDKADAKRCWVLSSMTHAAFEDEYDEDLASWPKSVGQSQFDWVTRDVVYVAEFYDIEEKKETRSVYRDLTGKETTYTEDELDQQKLDMLKATQQQLVRQKKIKRKRVHKYLMSGAAIIEDCGYIAGTCIPIVPSYGKRWYVDNVERAIGHTQLAMDAQRLANMLRSKLAEYAASGSVQVPIMHPEEIDQFAGEWATQNTEPKPYLRKNLILDQAGNAIVKQQEYTQVSQIPPAHAALMQTTEQDMQDLLGNQQAGEELQPNMSGKAVDLVQQRLDMQTFIYLSNHAKAKKRSGEIWLSMMKDIVVEDARRMKTVAEDGAVGSAVLNVAAWDEESGREFIENDLSSASLDINVDVGPSSSSRRSATVRELTGLLPMTQDPQTMQVLTASILMNMEGEGLGGVRKYFRKKLVEMGVEEPTPEEQKEMEAAKAAAAQQPPDPQTQYLLASAASAQADAQKKQADTQASLANVGLTQAKTAQTVVDTEIQKGEHAINVTKLVRGDDAPQPPAEKAPAKQP